MTANNSYHSPFQHLINPGHTACAGCGLMVAMINVLDALGPNTIVVGATGCSEVTTSKYPQSAFKVPWIHSVFENPAAVATGIEAVLKKRGQDKDINVLAWGGDGAIFDIGIGFISAAWERRENFLLVCLDNEAYMNTGIQSSGATPLDAYTMTTPSGEKSCGNANLKKDMIRIALAHDVAYAATATIGDLTDLTNKVKKAAKIKGPKYIQVLTTCIPGWNVEPKLSINLARLAQQTGIYPVLEYEYGKLTNVKKVAKDRPRVEEYLKPQGRFKHLFSKSGKCQSGIEAIQTLADENVEKYGLLK
ncbi:MAG TPA: thiamine pyrophosphate-dependent enzyme [Candidatus Bipolaricaulota bacterium]|nr:thiamine pyrophosphate-dependent enzyme [Candidatus Bipolaricaulota bacterium]